MKWEELSHEDFKLELAAGIAERDRRMRELMGLTSTESRGPGRPAKDPFAKRSNGAEEAANTDS